MDNAAPTTLNHGRNQQTVDLNPDPNIELPNFFPILRRRQRLLDTGRASKIVNHDIKITQRGNALSQFFDAPFGHEVKGKNMMLFRVRHFLSDRVKRIGGSGHEYYPGSFAGEGQGDS